MVRSSDSRESYQPRDRAEWRRWLEANHGRPEGVWLVLFKKGAAHRGLSLDEAVEEALCFGWIDSRLNRIDEDRFKIIMSPRRLGSNWSRTNRLRVEKLIANGSMTPAGLAKVETAKRDGSWDRLEEIEELRVPPDLMERLDDVPGAKQRFAGLPPSHQARYLYWITEAKRSETRSRRIDELVRKLGERTPRGGEE